MHYLVTSSLFLAACSSAAATLPPTPAPRNLVCERVAIIQAEAKTPADKLAKCEREFSDSGEMHTHTARVTPHGGGTIVCGLNAGQLSMACGGLEAQQPKAAEPAKAEPVKAAKAK